MSIPPARRHFDHNSDLGLTAEPIATAGHRGRFPCEPVLHGKVGYLGPDSHSAMA